MYFKKLNKNLKKYFDILCDNDYPEFINKYLETSTMKRLSGIGQFCGSDYTKFNNNIRFWYTRLDHSVDCALMTWYFTKDKIQTLAALFHDLGTPVFSHTIDYLFDDYSDCESSERSVEDIINSSFEIKNLLKEDNIKIKDVISVEKYPIFENKRPGLCIDRLDGVLHAAYIWAKIINLKDVEEIFKSIIVLKNEMGIDEIGFKDLNSALKFFRVNFDIAILLESNEDKFVMKLLADIIKLAIKKEIITLNDLYELSEFEIINKFKEDNKISILWNKYVNMSNLKNSKLKPKKYYFVSFKPKKRSLLPLYLNNGNSYRINKYSKEAKELYNKFLKYKDFKYCYVKDILMDEFK